MRFFSMRKELVVPTLVSVLFNFMIYLYAPLLPIYFKEAGISDQMLGIVFACFPLMLVLFSPVVGALADHVGRKRIIYAGIVFQAIAAVLYIWMPTVPMIMLARFLAAVGWAGVGLITLAKVEDHLSKEERGSKAGVFLSFSYIGFLIAPPIGAYLAQLVSIRFTLMLSLFGMLILLVWLTLWKSHHKPVIEKRDFNPWRSIKIFLSHKKLRAMAILGAAMNSKNPVFQIFLPLLLLQMGYTYAAVGMVFFLDGFSYLFQGVAGKIVDKVGSAKVVIISVLFASSAFTLMGFADSIVFLCLLVVFQALASAFWNISAWTLMSETGEQEGIEGVVVGSYSSLARIGYFILSVASGFIAVAYGMRILFVIAGGVSLLALALTARTLASPE
ncbi:MFS transporter [Candidatus Woesearchaeota archaeon]|nr:MFS transporter [Candidatus Woesearchaeota archaeon]